MYIMTATIITSSSRHKFKWFSGITITFGVKVEHKVQTTRVHNTARSLMDVNRDGYRDQINIGYKVCDLGLFPAYHNTIRCSLKVHEHNSLLTVSNLN